jgi:hypothetical protein
MKSLLKRQVVSHTQNAHRTCDQYQGHRTQEAWSSAAQYSIPHTACQGHLHLSSLNQNRTMPPTVIVKDDAHIKSLLSKKNLLKKPSLETVIFQ